MGGSWGRSRSRGSRSIAKIIFAQAGGNLDVFMQPRNRGTSKLVVQGIWVHHVKSQGLSSWQQRGALLY